MATRLYLRSLTSTLGGAGQLSMSTRVGRTSTTAITTAVASGTNIPVTATAGGQALTWFSEPITTGFTLSGTVTVNIRGLESALTVNAGRGVLVERTNNAGVVQSSILADVTVPTTITEFTTADAANGAATYTPTSTTFVAGDRIKVTVKIRNVGVMAAGTATISYDGPTAAAAGETYIQFTEDFITDLIQDVPPFEFRGGGYYG